MNQKNRTIVSFRLVPGVLFLAIIAMAACDTIQSDFANLKDELIPPTPTQAAEWMFDEYDAEKRRKGLTLIANAPFGAKEMYVEAYELRVAEEKNSIVRSVAVRALARHGSAEHAPLIAQRLEDESQQVRWEAAKGLQRIHNPDVVPLMLAAFRNKDEDSDVRAALAGALAQYPEDRVFQALVQHGLGGRELLLNRTSAESLETLCGEQFADDSAAWLAWYHSTDDPFAGKRDYYYPTYHRSTTMFEHLTFWTSNQWEQSRQPAGLRSETGRSTYDDSAAESADG